MLPAEVREKRRRIWELHANVYRDPHGRLVFFPVRWPQSIFGSRGQAGFFCEDVIQAVAVGRRAKFMAFAVLVFYIVCLAGLLGSSRSLHMGPRGSLGMAVWLLVAVIPALVVAPSATSWLAARCMPRATWRLTVVEAYRQKMDAGLKEPLQGPWAALLALFALGSAWTFLTPTHGLVRVMCLTILLNTALPLVLSHLMMVHILRHGARASAAFTLCMLILAECSQSATALAILAVDRIN